MKKLEKFCAVYYNCYCTFGTGLRAKLLLWIKIIVRRGQKEKQHISNSNDNE